MSTPDGVGSQPTMIQSETITPYAGFHGQQSFTETPETQPAMFGVYIETETNPGTRALVYQTNFEYDAINAALKTIEYYVTRNPYDVPLFHRETPRVFIQDARCWYVNQIFHSTYGAGFRIRGDVIVSSRVRKVIDSMTRDNPIATLLANYWSQDAQDARAELTQPTPLVGNFIDFDAEKSSVTYLPSTKPIDPRISYDGFNSRGRVNAKPVRAFRTLYPELLSSFNDHDFELFSNLFMARINPSAQFQFVSGEDIRTYYDESSYASELGWSSCMSYSYCYDYLEIYAANPDKIQLLVSLEDGLVTGRALVWRQDDGTMFLDRVYANDQRHEQEFHDHMEDTYPNTVTRNAGYITLKYHDFSEYPYMDTFRYLDMENGALCTNPPGGHYKYLCSTDGQSDEYGASRTYAVRMTRTVTEEMTVYVTAESESDAEDIANSEYRNTSVTRGEMTADDTGGYVSIDEAYCYWYAQDAEHDPDFD